MGGNNCSFTKTCFLYSFYFMEFSVSPSFCACIFLIFEHMLAVFFRYTNCFIYRTGFYLKKRFYIYLTSWALVFLRHFMFALSLFCFFKCSSITHIFYLSAFVFVIAFLSLLLRSLSF